ncbi:MAG: hypothetical protein FJZ04_02225 [Candidatus Moranbacteria bacterium]|nr:hypothetical protein [Candidatus Moranbacteria bacterium]
MIENLSGYSKEKIPKTLNQLKHLVEVMENFLTMLRFCEKLGIRTPELTKMSEKFSSLRYLGGLAGPNSGLVDLEVVFENGQAAIARSLSGPQRIELDRLIAAECLRRSGADKHESWSP